MRSLNITDELLSKTKERAYITMLLWRELKLHVTPSAHLFEDHIVYQMTNMAGGLIDKSEEHIERAHQDGKSIEIIYCGLTNFQ